MYYDSSELHLKQKNVKNNDFYSYSEVINKP